MPADATAPFSDLLAVGFHGTRATPELLHQLARLRAKQLILFSRNFESAEQLTTLLAGLSQGLGWPLLVLLDHEGGRIIRFSSGVTRFPDALTVGRTQPPEAAERQGAVEAAELKALGVHVNLAPCVDVLAPGCDSVIGDRSYGEDPARVAQHGAARIRGLQSGGVAACAKHFPGLGAVPRDPHRVLPTIGLGWPDMERIHLPPFCAAIEAGVATVMSSHVCYPALGEPEGLPATFSRPLVNGLLRRRLGFRGGILTDDLEMGALGAFGRMDEVAVRAVEAGHDLLLICEHLDAAAEALAGLEAAWRSGRLPAERLETAAARVHALREKFLAKP